jgi:hypothetical protein
MSTESEQNVNHLLLHLTVRTVTSRTEMAQLQKTRTLGVKKWFSGLGKQLEKRYVSYKLRCCSQVKNLVTKHKTKLCSHSTSSLTFVEQALTKEN